MPRKNGTGPLGKGPLTGYGMGDCVVRLSDNIEILEKSKEEVVKMPGGDRTGPYGAGPMTGRGAGYCAGYNMPGYANPVRGKGMGYGRGMGRGRGLGRGFGRGQHFGWYGANPYSYGAPYASVKEEAEMLRTQARAMQDEIQAIHTRIEELESGAGNKE